MKYCNKNCEVIKIPHYRNSIYFYKCLKGYNGKYQLLYHYDLEKLVNINNTNDTLKLIKKEIEIMENYNYDKNDMEETFNKNFNEFEEIDKLSDIKMFDFYKNNFKKSRLFMGRSYPSSIFFFELSNRILEKLNIVRNEKFVDLQFAENTTEIIPNYWYKFCKFEFENKLFLYGHMEVKDYEWYYIILSTKNPNITDKNLNEQLLKIIR